VPLGQKTTITTDTRPSASRLGIPDHAQSPRPKGRRERVVKRTQRPWQADQHLRQRPSSRAGHELDCWVCDGREKGLTLARLDKVDDDGGLDSIFGNVAEMERGLTAKREALAAQQRSNRRPPVKRVKEKDVLATLTQLRDLLQSDVGVAAPALKALVGDVVIESRIVEGRARPEMYVRFTINAIPALALLARGKAAGGLKSDDPTASTWEFLNGDRWTQSKTPCEQAITPTQPQPRPNEIVVLLKKKLQRDAMQPQIV